MANELKIGNKLLVLNNPINLASLTSDPGTASNGDIYYNSTSNQLKVYQNGSWLAVQAGGAVTLAGQALNTANIIVGDGTNLSAAVDTSAAGDILANSSGGLTIKNLVISDSMISSLAAISRSKIAAGTMNRLVVNDGATGALSDAAAITASRALISDANGIPTHSSVTATELGYLSGVTSSVQTQISSKVSKSGDTMSGNLLFDDTLGVDSAGGATTLNLGTANATIVNIGHSGATVNILGSVQYVQTSNLQVADSLVTLNKGGASASGNGAGIEIEEGGSITAYLKIANSRASWDFKAPSTAGTVRLTPGALSIVIDQDLQVSASPTFAGLALSSSTVSTAAVFNGANQLVSSAVSATELGYLSGVTSSVQTQLNGKANTALSNLASVAINTALLPVSNNTIALGSASFNWSAGYMQQLISAADILINANTGSSNVNLESAKFRRSKDGTNFVEQEYVDSATLNANVAVATAISGLSFAFASFKGCIVEYTITEATSGKVRVGRFMVSTDGTNVSSSDVFSETAALGSSSGLSLTAAINGANIDIQYNNTHATNACTMRADIKRLRA